MEGFMDVDEDEHALSPMASHPLSQLHAQLISHLSYNLPELAYEAARLEQERRKKSQPTPTGQKKSALYASIHAPKVGEREKSTRAFIMPSQEQVQAWKPLDCIHFALEFPPREDDSANPRNRRPPSIEKLCLFLLPHDQPGGRRGKDWSIGDWRLSLEELDQVGSFCGWQNVRKCVEICRSQLSGLGLDI